MANYWIFQANPRRYFIADYWLEDYVKSSKIEDWWGVKKIREGKIFKDDIVYIWKCKDEPPKYDKEDNIGARAYHKWKTATGWTNKGRGIYAVGCVVRPAYEHKFGKSDIPLKYYVDWHKATDESQLRVDFEYILNLVDSPLLATKIPWCKLPDMWERFAKPGAGTGRKYFHLEHREGQTLWRLIFPALPPPI